MGIMKKPEVIILKNGGKFCEHEYKDFWVKVYIPANNLDGQINNYSFKAPLFLIFEEKRMDMIEAIDFAEHSGLADIAAANDAGVIFVFPTDENGWDDVDEKLYISLISEIKIGPTYEDGLVKFTDFFTREFKGYFIRGAIFKAYIYSFGKSADYVATHLLKTLNGEYLWGPGEITPAMCSMEKLSVEPIIEREDIPILSVSNNVNINKKFSKCEHVLIKDNADYTDDYKKFVCNFKMWCGNLSFNPDFNEMGLNEEAGSVVVKTADDHIGQYKNQKEHKVGYFAYYNNGIFEDKKVPLVLAFHGGGDSALYFTYITEWYNIVHRDNILYVAIDNHLDVSPTEVIEVLEHLKTKYKIDENRIYATGFSMGSGKTWELYMSYPEIFAGVMPNSALFPMKNPFGPDFGDKLNLNVSVPMFYSGGNKSFVPEIPFQDITALERIQYLAKVNKLNKNFDISFDNKDNWEEPEWGMPGDREEKFFDESRNSEIRVNYYYSEDGVCRTALATINDQVHECRPHTCELAWKFISKFIKN